MSIADVLVNGDDLNGDRMMLAGAYALCSSLSHSSASANQFHAVGPNQVCYSRHFASLRGFLPRLSMATVQQLELKVYLWSTVHIKRPIALNLGSQAMA